MRAGATSCNDAIVAGKSIDARNPLPATKLCDGTRPGATEGANAPGRTRTCDLRIRSPLLYPAELRAHAIAWWLIKVSRRSAIGRPCADAREYTRIRRQRAVDAL